jgi:hypothetical protein
MEHVQRYAMKMASLPGVQGYGQKGSEMAVGCVEGIEVMMTIR